MSAVCHHSVSPSTSGLQEMFQNKAGDILAEILSCGQVWAKVDSGKDPAQDCLPLSCRESAKGTLVPCFYFKGAF
jgi:hypothetical protein